VNPLHTGKAILKGLGQYTFIEISRTLLMFTLIITWCVWYPDNSVRMMLKFRRFPVESNCIWPDRPATVVCEGNRTHIKSTQIMGCIASISCKLLKHGGTILHSTYSLRNQINSNYCQIIFSPKRQDVFHVHLLYVLVS